MVAIHGNWCGPNWTGGRALAASDPRVDWSVPAIDALDAACKVHDKDCAHSLGCSAKADRILSSKALFFAIFNPTMAPIANAVSAGILIASLGRDR